jgi:hypothetical protein
LAQSPSVYDWQSSGTPIPKFNMDEVADQPAAIYLPMNLRSGTPKLGET